MLDGEKREKGAEKSILRNKTTNLPNLLKNINPYIKEAQQTVRWINMKRVTPRHVIIILLKEKNLKSHKEKPTHTSNAPIRLTADCSSEWWKPEGSRMALKGLKRVSCQPRILYLANHSSKLKAKMKTLADKQRKFIVSKTALHNSTEIL